ncbi:S9 family peptidase [Halomonas koreensis]|uniref:Prolyl oligopeptidase family serine peptidase n=1 Tax=Halomonas koreensis TaxID=245385 RepID=A0ABU1G6D9_9GAMM|nr:prolyl oligopeptidase family serine peptidase [Halomonas koreensis]MDR5868047.1 prolyl oligopeptidase family serine peptidase [Halomonas koreensis]
MKAQPPQAPRRTLPPSPVTRFRRAEDPGWHWLEDRDDPQVTAFLEAANAEAEAWFAPLDDLTERLYHGHLARRELAVRGLPTALDHYTIWSETAVDADHPVWWRHPNGAPQAAEPFLDLEARAGRHAFYEVGDMALPPDEAWLAWTEDTRGDEAFTLWLKRLPDGEPVALLEDIGPELCWAEDGVTLLFTRHDATRRPDSVWRLPLALGETPSAGAPALIRREDDPEFFVGIGKTRSRAWLLLEAASKDTSETHLVPAAAPATPPRCFRPRERGVEYGLEHRPGHFYVLHNREAPHFCLDRVDDSDPTGPAERLVAHREDTTLEGVDAFAWGLVLTERDHHQAQVHLRVMELDAQHATRRDARLALPETPCSLALGEAPHFADRRLRLHEESFTLPPTWTELDLDSGERRRLKQQPVHGDLSPDRLVSERLWATSHDGERIPVSVVMRGDLVGHPLPTLLYGYGAYGEVLDPWFSVARLELLARGVAFAVAHVRGGGDRGEPWYLAGKLEHKANSFHDFLAARDALVERGVSDDERIVAYGASAGGLLVGASLNLAPERFRAAVLDVPFVDVLRTMDNPDLPLTTAEYSEWGDPREPSARQRIGAYSPLDNLPDRPWPPVFLQGSWFDTRVSYWEPAKLYARLGELAEAAGEAPPDHPTLLRTDLAAGHGGASGRFKAWHDGARQDAFILWALGLEAREA